MATSEQIVLAAIVYFGQVIVVLQINQQKQVGMVSINTVWRTYSEKIHKP